MAAADKSLQCERVVRFLLGLSDGRVARVLVEYGLSQQDLDEGWRRLQAAVGATLEVTPETRDLTEIERRLDAWENRWFPIAKATVFARAATSLAASSLCLGVANERDCL